MKGKKSKTKNDVSSKRKIAAAVLVVMIILAAGIFIFKTKFATQKSPYKGNVTDIIRKNGEIISYKYNRFQFEKNSGTWITEIQQGKQPYIVAFTYGPINVENISITFKGNYFQSMTTPGSKVYISFDHNSTNASYIATSMINLITNLGSVYKVSAQRTCLVNSSSCVNAPIVTCENTPDNIVIQFKESEVPYAVYEDNCLTIYGAKDNFIKTTERVILNWYGIL